MSPLRRRSALTALAGMVLIAGLAGCGARDGLAGPDSGSVTPASPAAGPSAGPTSDLPSDAVSGPADELTTQDVASVEQALRAADGTLEQADQQFADD